MNRHTLTKAAETGTAIMANMARDNDIEEVK